MSCGKVENNAFIEEWEYKLKFRVKLNDEEVKGRVGGWSGRLT